MARTHPWHMAPWRGARPRPEDAGGPGAWGPGQSGRPQGFSSRSLESGRPHGKGDLSFGLKGHERGNWVLTEPTEQSSRVPPCPLGTRNASRSRAPGHVSRGGQGRALRPASLGAVHRWGHWRWSADGPPSPLGDMVTERGVASGAAFFTAILSRTSASKVLSGVLGASQS